MSLDPADFALTDDELRTEWQQRIRPGLFGGVSRNPKPLAVFVGAQPGAGKTLAIEKVQDRYPDRDFIALDSDELRKAHPRFDEIMAGDPDRMPVLTNQAAGAWFRMGLDDAWAGNYDVLIENSFHNPELVLTTARQFAADSGHRVEVVALAVPEADSRLGMVDRYVQARRRGLPARWTNNASHDAGYKGVPATVAALELSPLVAYVLVTDRAGEPLYDSTPGAINRDPSAADAITRVRAIPKTGEQAAAWTRRYTDVAASVQSFDNHDSPDIVAVMDRLDQDARDIATASSRPDRPVSRAGRTLDDLRRRARSASVADPTTGTDYDDLDYEGPSHHHGGPTPHR